MKDVSIRAARLHQTRALLCPEKASLYQEKSPRSWASGPAPGDSGRREALGVRARPASTGPGGGGRAPAPSGAAAPGPARAAVCGGARLRLPLTQAGRVVLRATPERIRLPLEVPTVPGEPPSRPFQQAARRPGDRGRGRRGRGSAAPACARRRGTVLSRRVASRLCWPMSPPPGRSSPTPTQRQSSADAHVVLQATAGAFPTAPPVGRPRARIAVCSSWVWPTHPTVLPAASPGAST